MPLEIKRCPDLISAKNNPLVVRLGKLEEKKHREREGLFRLDGIKLLLEALSFGADIEYILVRDDAFSYVMKSVDEFFDKSNVYSSGTLVVLGKTAFDKLSDEKSPEGVITVVKYIHRLHKRYEEENCKLCSDGEKLFMLESVRDPGNMGTILRSAAAFGIETVIMTEDCADIYNPKTLRAAMGAIFKIKTIKIRSAGEAIADLQKNGRKVLAAALDKDAKRLGDVPLSTSDVFLIGNEGHGLSNEAIAAADRRIFIPMAENTESLNAAVAASICLWEISKT